IHPFVNADVHNREYNDPKYNYNYYVVSNTNGTEIDMDSAWDTSAIAEGIYTIRVTARDHARNS
ncbi:hypothetical protein K8T06_14345, partial [bacterium]|nr:hypothetical protein [bacterium]